MYVIIAKKERSGNARGYKREDNHVVVTVTDEAALAKAINDLVNEGERENHHQIIQVLWKGPTA